MKILYLRLILLLLMLPVSTSLFCQNQLTPSGEYYIDTDPGAGNGVPVSAADGNFSNAFEKIFRTGLLFTANGNHTIGIRIKDNTGHWSAAFTSAVSAISADSIRISQAEYFVDADPGTGNGNVMLAFDGAFTKAFETVVKSGLSISTSGNHTMNIRVKDNSGNWSPVFSSAISAINPADHILLNQAEYFVDTDPGNGNGNVMLAFDGAFSKAFETVVKSGLSISTSGNHTMNIRVKDNGGNWSSVFSSVISAINPADHILLNQAEYFFDTDPGQSNATPMLAFDGNYSDAFEQALASGINAPATGKHTLSMRVMDNDSRWSPVFSTAFSVLHLPDSILITKAEYFIDADPGQGNALPMLAFDGNFSDAFEQVLASGINTPATGKHKLSMRVLDNTGNWSPVFTMPFTVLKQRDSILITSAEYFIDADPGQGNALPMLAFDGNFSAAFEQVAASGLNVPATGKHTLNMRVLDKAGNWSPVFTMSLISLHPADNILIAKAEYFFDTDPGQGSASPMLAFDGNYSDAFEQALASTVIAPATGKHTLSMRVMDNAGNWGPVFSTVFSTLQQHDSILITKAEYFFDTDPGQGNALPMLAFDGNFSDAFEQVVASGINVPAIGRHTLNMRVLDNAGRWSAVFTMPVTALRPADNILVTKAEYFFDTDPGQGSAAPMLAFDGNYSDAFEQALASTVIAPAVGKHVLGMRVVDNAGNWGPVFSTAFSTLQQHDSILITKAEYFFDNDPGQGNALPMLAFDGNFSDAFEQVVASGINVPTVGRHTLNMRVLNNAGHWSAVFTMPVTALRPADNIQVTKAEYFFDTDPGQGSASPMLAFDGNYSDAFEQALASTVIAPAVGKHVLGMRVVDNAGNWGPVFSTAFSTLQQHDSILITSAEYFFDSDPGQGNASLMLAFDGNFSDAFEQVVAAGIDAPATGTHTLNMRVLDKAGNWSAVFTMPVTTLQSDQVYISQGEYFWDTDPGVGGATPLLALDGNFDNAFEQCTQNLAPIPGPHVLCVRVADGFGNWSPLFRTVVIGPDAVCDTASVTISTPATIVCPGASARFKASFNGSTNNGGSTSGTLSSGDGGATGAPDNHNYQWSVNGYNTGSNSAVYEEQSVINGATVVCMVTQPGCPDTLVSNPIVIVIQNIDSPSIGIGTNDTLVCSRNPVEFSSSSRSPGYGPFYQWYVNGNAAGDNSQYFTPDSVQNGDLVTCMLVSSDVCAIYDTAWSNAVHMATIASVSPAVTINTETDTVCVGQTLKVKANVTGGAGNEVYTWYVNNIPDTTTGPLYANNTITDGSQVVCVYATDFVCANPISVASNVLDIAVDNNCYSTRLLTTGNSSVDSSVQSGNTEISIFPNPTTGKFFIKAQQTGNNNLLNVDVFNCLGECVYTHHDMMLKNNESFEIDMQITLAAGIYMVKVSGENADYKKPLVIVGGK